MAQKYDYTVLIGGVDMTAVVNKMGGPDIAQEYLGDEWVLTRTQPKSAPEVPPEPKVYLEPLFEGVEIDPTDATTTDDDAKRVFSGGYDPALLGVKSKPASKTKTRVDKLVVNGKFADFLGKTASELEARRLQWEQGIKFCVDHKGKLRKGGYATFFVCTTDGEAVLEDLSNVFVAVVYFDGRGQLSVYRDSVSFDYTWYAGFGHRVVSRQQ